MAFDIEQYMQNPWTHIGLGILAANKPGAGFGQAVGRGGMLGMQNHGLLQQHQQRQAELEAAQQRQAQQRQAQQGLMQGMPAQMQQAMQAYPELAADLYRQEYHPKPTALAQDLQLLAPGAQPGTPEMVAALRQLRPGQSVKVNVEQPGAAKVLGIGEEIGRDLVKAQGQEIMAASKDANKTLQRSRLMLDLLRDTGSGTWKNRAASAASAFGLETSLVENQQLWGEQTGRMALQDLQMFKGPTTDFEYKVAEGLQPQYGKTPFANYVPSKAAERAAKRARKEYGLYRKYLKQFSKQIADGTDPGFYEWVDETVDDPLFKRWGIADFRVGFEREILGKAVTKQSREPDAVIQAITDIDAYERAQQ